MRRAELVHMAGMKASFYSKHGLSEAGDCLLESGECFEMDDTTGNGPSGNRNDSVECTCWIGLLNVVFNTLIASHPTLSMFAVREFSVSINRTLFLTNPIPHITLSLLLKKGKKKRNHHFTQVMKSSTQTFVIPFSRTTFRGLQSDHPPYVFNIFKFQPFLDNFSF